MLSDALFEATQEIKRYQRDFAAIYDDMADDLRVLVAVLDHGRQWLDTPEPVGRAVEPALLRRLADWLDDPSGPFPEA